MQISKRLEAVAGMVTPGCIVADIGTDHAYIPIYLVQKGIAPRVVAMDVNRGPLEKAVSHIRRYGLKEKIGTRLSDGLAALQPGEAESIIIAGMGGPLTVRILTEGADRTAACRELILQPQSEIRLVRVWLEEHGYRIVREEFVCEDGKYYPMMRAVRTDSMETAKKDRASDGKAASDRAAVPAHRAEEFKMSETELRYGPLLLEQRNPVLREYLKKEQRKNSLILEALEGQNGEGAKNRRAEVEYEQELIQRALCCWEQPDGGQEEKAP